MKLADMPEINPVDLTVDDVEEMLFTSYQNITGRTLGQADPVRLFILFVADALYRTCEKINYAGRQNFLRTAEGKSLDALAANICVTRTAANAAHARIRITLSGARTVDTVIPAGTRVSPANNIYFATDENVVITSGNLTADVRATCTSTGITGNDYQPGEISKIVDPVAYVATMVNTTKSEGGSDEEDDDSLRERVFEAPERFSTAGPAGAYGYYTKAVSSLISDVYIWSPSPGVVQDVFLLKGGVVPEQEMLDEVTKALSAGGVRPLTDKVEVLAPAIVKYDVDVSYSVNSDADLATVSANVTEAVNGYIAWQKEKLNRDIDPSELVHRIKAVSGTCHIIVNSPSYTVVGRDAYTTDESSDRAVEVAYADSIKIAINGRED